MPRMGRDGEEGWGKRRGAAYFIFDMVWKMEVIIR
jgi:hypothetical protein